MEIREITNWDGLQELFQTEHDSDLPLPEFGTIYGIYEDDKLKGFALAEHVIMIGQFTTTGSGNIRYAKALIDFFQAKYPPGISVGAIASKDKFRKLYGRLDMQEIPGTLYRRN